MQKGRLRLFDAAEDGVCVAIATVMLALTSIQVVTRYVFNAPLSWSEELVRLLFVWLNLLGASVAIRHRSHISFNLVTAILSERPQATLRIGTNALMLGFLLFVIWPSVRFVRFMNTIPSAGLEWPLGVFYLSVPVAAFPMIVNLVRDSMAAWKAVCEERG